ncbi:MAG: bile acid:sodium symporter family protein [Candidatus Marinimicrobia bacterium]|jgi:bile acid:Na+ symporter, BASS family|nr:bile acid:sodium symporter family protein [Candidatus Neomarinimicrobiota bacterium]
MLIDVFLPLSLVFIMFSLGLGLSIEDFKNVIKEPRAFSIGLINQMVLLPLFAFTIITIFNITNELAVGMMILACCPGGVTSNVITKLAKGDTALSISYTAVISIATVFTLPLIVGFSMQYFMGENAPEINIFALGLTMFLVTALPVGLGLLVHSKFRNFTHSFEPKAGRISTILFVVILIGALTSEWDTFISNLSILGPTIITLITVMIIIGYSSSRLFKMNKKQAITIAIESSIQNATVGITIGNLILSQASGVSILSLPSAVYGILMYCVCLPVVLWFAKRKL